MNSIKNITDSWTRQYSRISRKGDQFHTANIFVGFNANIDVIIYMDKFFEKILLKNGIDKVKKTYTIPKKIKTKKEFLEVLLYCITATKEMEIVTENQELLDWVEKTFPTKEHRIGGQAGIMSKFLDSIGCRVVFSTPKLSSEMAKLLPKGLLIPEETGIQRLLNAKKSKDTKTNYIFEYKKGLSIFGKTSIRSDRFILATRPKANAPKFYQPTTTKFLSFFELIDRAILSGFHALDTKDISEFEKIHTQIEKIKKTNPELKIHIEDAYITDAHVSNELMKFMVTHVHSLGLNEVELSNTLEAINEKKISNTVRKSNYSLLGCYLGAKTLYNKMNLERLHMHTYNYCLIILSKNYGTSPEKMRDALLFSILCAAGKASKGEVLSIKDIKNVKSDLNLDGLNDIKQIHKSLGLCDGFLETGICDMGDHFLIAVPTKISKTLKSTVGLGDVVSSSAFVYDVL